MAPKRPLISKRLQRPRVRKVLPPLNERWERHAPLVTWRTGNGCRTERSRSSEPPLLRACQEERSLIDAIFCQVVRKRPLTDPHQLGGILLHTAGAFERAPNRFLFDPFDIGPQLRRRKS